MGCSQTSDIKFHNDIKAYEGTWHNAIFVKDDLYLEDLIIKNNSIEYLLSNSMSHIVYDMLSGSMILGNENKIAWNCISDINNMRYQISWHVLSLSQHQMTLYSNLEGEHTYEKVINPPIDEFEINDTLMEMFQYFDYLPLRRDNLLETFGTYNRLGTKNGIEYYIRHPMFDKILFLENVDNDSIYSYSLHVKDHAKYSSIIMHNLKKIRAIHTTTEYIDSDSLENCNFVVTSDKSSDCINFTMIKGYDYWPNMTHYLGEPLQKFKADYESKYIYALHKDAGSGMVEYSFNTEIDSICHHVSAFVDTTLTIRKCCVELHRSYQKNKIDRATEEFDRVSSLLGKKYKFVKYDIDENSNTIKYYHHDISNDKKMEVKLCFIYYEPDDIRKLYRIRVEYSLL